MRIVESNPAGGSNDTERPREDAEALRPVSLNQLLTGIFIVLSKKYGVESIYTGDTRVDECFVEVCEEFGNIAEANGLEPAFQIRLGLHGNSPRLRQALNLAVQRGAINSNFSERALRLRAADRYTTLEETLRHSPGPPEMYEHLAKIFLDAWDGCPSAR